MEARDKNTKYFHKFSSHRKNTNTILEIKDEVGGTTHLFKEKAKATLEHFQKRFTAPPGCPISEILEVLNLLPKIITEEMQQDLMEEVIEEDLNKIISTFQKGKSPGPNGSHWNFS